MFDTSEDSTTATSIQFSVASSHADGGGESRRSSASNRPHVAPRSNTNTNNNNTGTKLPLSPAPAVPPLKSKLAAGSVPPTTSGAALKTGSRHPPLSPRASSSTASPPPLQRSHVRSPPSTIQHTASASVSLVEAPVVLHPSRSASPHDASLLFVQAVAQLDTPLQPSLAAGGHRSGSDSSRRSDDEDDEKEDGERTTKGRDTSGGSAYQPRLIPHTAQRRSPPQEKSVGGGSAKAPLRAASVTNHSITSSKGSIDFQVEDEAEGESATPGMSGKGASPPQLATPRAAASPSPPPAPSTKSVFMTPTKMNAQPPATLHVGNKTLVLKGPFPSGAGGGGSRGSGATSTPSPPRALSPEKLIPLSAPGAAVDAGRTTTTTQTADKPFASPFPRQELAAVHPVHDPPSHTSALTATSEKLQQQQQQQQQQLQPSQQQQQQQQRVVHQRSQSLSSSASPHISNVPSGSNLNHLRTRSQEAAHGGGPLHVGGGAGPFPSHHPQMSMQPPHYRVSSLSVQPEDDPAFCTVSEMTNAASLRGGTHSILPGAVGVGGWAAGPMADGNTIGSRRPSMIPVVSSRRVQSFDMSLDESNALLTVNSPRNVSTSLPGTSAAAAVNWKGRRGSTASQLNLAAAAGVGGSSSGAVDAALSTPSPGVLTPSPTHQHLQPVMPLPTFHRPSSAPLVPEGATTSHNTHNNTTTTTATAAAATTTPLVVDSASNRTNVHASPPRQETSTIAHASLRSSKDTPGSPKRQTTTTTINSNTMPPPVAGEESATPRQREEQPRRRSSLTDLLKAVGGKNSPLLCRHKSGSTASKSGTEDEEEDNNNNNSRNGMEADRSSASLHSRRSNSHSLASGLSRMSSRLKRGAQKIISAGRPVDAKSTSQQQQQQATQQQRQDRRTEGTAERQTLADTATNTTFTVAPAEFVTSPPESARRGRSVSAVAPSALSPAKLQTARSSPTRAVTSSADGSIDFHTDNEGSTAPQVGGGLASHEGQTRPAGSVPVPPIPLERELSLPHAVEEQSTAPRTNKEEEEAAEEKLAGQQRRAQHPRSSSSSGKKKKKTVQKGSNKDAYRKSSKHRHRNRRTRKDALSMRSSSADSDAASTTRSDNSFSESYSTSSSSTDATTAATNTSLTSSEVLRQKEKERRRRRQRREGRRRTKREQSDTDDSTAVEAANRRRTRVQRRRRVVASHPSSAASGSDDDDDDDQERRAKTKTTKLHRDGHRTEQQQQHHHHSSSSKKRSAKKEKESATRGRRHRHHHHHYQHQNGHNRSSSNRLGEEAAHLYQAAEDYVRRRITRSCEQEITAGADDHNAHTPHSKGKGGAVQNWRGRHEESDRSAAHEHRGTEEEAVELSAAARLAARRREILRQSRVHSGVNHFDAAWHTRTAARRRLWQQHCDAAMERQRRLQQLRGERKLRSQEAAVAAAVAQAASRSTSRARTTTTTTTATAGVPSHFIAHKRAKDTVHRADVPLPAASVRDSVASSYRTGRSPSGAVRRLEKYEAALTSQIQELDDKVERMRRRGLWAEASPAAAAAAGTVGSGASQPSTTAPTSLERSFPPQLNGKAAAAVAAEADAGAEEERGVKLSISNPSLPRAPQSAAATAVGEQTHITSKSGTGAAAARPVRGARAAPLSPSSSASFHANSYVCRLRPPSSSSHRSGSNHHHNSSSRARDTHAGATFQRGGSSPAPRKPPPPPTSVFTSIPSASSSSMHNATLYEQQKQPRQQQQQLFPSQRDNENTSSDAPSQKHSASNPASSSRSTFSPSANSQRRTAPSLQDLQQRYEKMLDELLQQVEAEEQEGEKTEVKKAGDELQESANRTRSDVETSESRSKFVRSDNILAACSTTRTVSALREVSKSSAPLLFADLEAAEVRRCAAALRAEYYRSANNPSPSQLSTTGASHTSSLPRQLTWADIGAENGDAEAALLEKLEVAYAQSLRPSCSTCRPQNLDEYVTLGLLAMLHDLDNVVDHPSHPVSAKPTTAGSKAVVGKSTALLKRGIREELYAPPKRSKLQQQQQQRQKPPPAIKDSAQATHADTVAMTEAALSSPPQPAPHPFTPSVSLIFPALRSQLMNAEDEARRAIVADATAAEQALRRRYIIETVCVLRTLRVREEEQEREEEEEEAAAKRRGRERPAVLSAQSLNSSHRHSDDFHFVHEPVTPALVTEGTLSNSPTFVQFGNFGKGNAQFSSALWRAPGTDSTDSPGDNDSERSGAQAVEEEEEDGHTTGGHRRPNFGPWRGTTPPPSSQQQQGVADRCDDADMSSGVLRSPPGSSGATAAAAAASTLQTRAATHSPLSSTLRGMKAPSVALTEAGGSGERRGRDSAATDTPPPPMLSLQEPPDDEDDNDDAELYRKAEEGSNATAKVKGDVPSKKPHRGTTTTHNPNKSSSGNSSIAMQSGGMGSKAGSRVDLFTPVEKNATPSDASSRSWNGEAVHSHSAAGSSTLTSSAASSSTFPLSFATHESSRRSLYDDAHKPKKNVTQPVDEADRMNRAESKGEEREKNKGTGEKGSPTESTSSTPIFELHDEVYNYSGTQHSASNTLEPQTKAADESADTNQMPQIPAEVKTTEEGAGAGAKEGEEVSTRKVEVVSEQIAETAVAKAEVAKAASAASSSSSSLNFQMDEDNEKRSSGSGEHKAERSSSSDASINATAQAPSAADAPGKGGDSQKDREKEDAASTADTRQVSASVEATTTTTAAAGVQTQPATPLPEKEDAQPQRIDGDTTDEEKRIASSNPSSPPTPSPSSSAEAEAEASPRSPTSAVEAAPHDTTDQAPTTSAPSPVIQTPVSKNGDATSGGRPLSIDRGDLPPSSDTASSNASSHEQAEAEAAQEKVGEAVVRSAPTSPATSSSSSASAGLPKDEVLKDVDETVRPSPVAATDEETSQDKGGEVAKDRKPEMDKAAQPDEKSAVKTTKDNEGEAEVEEEEETFEVHRTTTAEILASAEVPENTEAPLSASAVVDASPREDDTAKPDEAAHDETRDAAVDHSVSDAVLHAAAEEEEEEKEKVLSNTSSSGSEERGDALGSQVDDAASLTPPLVTNTAQPAGDAVPSPRRRVRFSLPMEHAHKFSAEEDSSSNDEKNEDDNHVEGNANKEEDERRSAENSGGDDGEGTSAVHAHGAADGVADMREDVTPEKVQPLSSSPSLSAAAGGAGVDGPAQEADVDEDSVSEKTAVDLLEKLNGLDALLLYKFPTYFTTGTDCDGLPGAVMRNGRDAYVPRRTSVNTSAAASAAAATAGLGVQRSELQKTETVATLAEEEKQRQLRHETGRAAEQVEKEQDADEDEDDDDDVLPNVDTTVTPESTAAFHDLTRVPPLATPSFSQLHQRLAPPRLPAESLATQLRRKYNLRPPRHAPSAAALVGGRRDSGSGAARLNSTISSESVAGGGGGAAVLPRYEVTERRRPSRDVPVLPSALATYTAFFDPSVHPANTKTAVFGSDSTNSVRSGRAALPDAAVPLQGAHEVLSPEPHPPHTDTPPDTADHSAAEGGVAETGREAKALHFAPSSSPPLPPSKGQHPEEAAEQQLRTLRGSEVQEPREGKPLPPLVSSSSASNPSSPPALTISAIKTPATVPRHSVPSSQTNRAEASSSLSDSSPLSVPLTTEEEEKRTSPGQRGDAETVAKPPRASHWF